MTLERKKQPEELKTLKRRQHSKSHYRENQETIKQQKKEARSVQKSNTAEAIKKRKYRAKKAKEALESEAQKEKKKAKARERNKQSQFNSALQKLAFGRSNI